MRGGCHRWYGYDNPILHRISDRNRILLAGAQTQSHSSQRINVRNARILSHHNVDGASPSHARAAS